METLTVDLGERRYPILIGAGLLRRPECLTQHIRSRQVLVVTNEVVAPLYLNPVREALRGRTVETAVLPDGEIHKTLDTVQGLFDTLVSARFNRDATLVALGGGVVGDITGFAAACYQRGVPFLQVPTTLLAQVDSSVGGKTGVNHPLGKNLIGAFHQPVGVVADTDTLATLDPRQFRAGLAEVIKYGLIRDPAFFADLETRLDALLAQDPDTLTWAIRRSCENKAAVVAEDEREAGVRALLNLGHTFGHAIETATGYRDWLHGEAVAAGTVLAAQLSARLGWLPEAAVTRIRTLFERTGLPVAPPADLSVERFLELMAVDKKVKDGRLRLVLLRDIGEAVVTDAYPSADLNAVLRDAGAAA